MKTYIAFLFIFLAGCINRHGEGWQPALQPGAEVAFAPCDTVTSDTAIVYLTDSTSQKENEMLRWALDSIQLERDSFYVEMVLYKYKVKRVKKYVGIVERNRSQEKFLLGWIKRAIADK